MSDDIEWVTPTNSIDTHANCHTNGYSHSDIDAQHYQYS